MINNCKYVLILRVFTYGKSNDYAKLEDSKLYGNFLQKLC